MDPSLSQKIEKARQGDRHELGLLLENFRPYLQLMARIEVGRRLQGKLGASDIVQETFLEAHRHFGQFEGHAEGQLIQWLRAILATTLANTIRRYLGTQARDVRLERELMADLDQSTCVLAQWLADPGSSPSEQVMRGEQTRLVADRLATLPDDYQAVLIMRHLEGLSFPEIAKRMERSLDSVEKLWVRGLRRLRSACEAEVA